MTQITAELAAGAVTDAAFEEELILQRLYAADAKADAETEFRQRVQASIQDPLVAVIPLVEQAAELNLRLYQLAATGHSE